MANEKMRMSLVTRKMPTKTTEGRPSPLSEWQPSKRAGMTNVGEDVGKREASDIAGGKVSWCSYCGKQCGGFSGN